MAQQDEGLPEGEIALLIALWAVEEAVNRLGAAQRRLSHVLTRRARPTPATESAVSGMPCAAEFCFVQPAEPVDSSAAIPESEIDRIERGGE